MTHTRPHPNFPKLDPCTNRVVCLIATKQPGDHSSWHKVLAQCLHTTTRRTCRALGAAPSDDILPALRRVDRASYWVLLVDDTFVVSSAALVFGVEGETNRFGEGLAIVAADWQRRTIAFFLYTIMWRFQDLVVCRGEVHEIFVRVLLVTIGRLDDNDDDNNHHGEEEDG
ncbi:hypothetical protein FAVG1_11088 [Fusarium avenaceum]|nr:hypothetical protein FAVG1_11088 [Fusarium avenaceum]